MNQHININKLASLEATLVRNSAHPLTHSLTGVKCRATSVAKNSTLQKSFINKKNYIDNTVWITCKNHI